MLHHREITSGELSQTDLKCYFAAYEACPPRTVELEQRIGIGSDFGNKWHRSQKECWLGWLTAKDCEVRSRGDDPACAPAENRWQHLLSSPLMFWVAENARMSEDHLLAAENAAQRATAENPKSGHPHGKYMREALPWSEVEQAILSGPDPVSFEHAEAAGLLAFDRLCERRSEFRELRQWLPSRA